MSRLTPEREAEIRDDAEGGLSDPDDIVDLLVEINALRKENMALRGDPPHAIGSVISNVGHDATTTGVITSVRDARPTRPIYVYGIHWSDGTDNERSLHETWVVTPATESSL